ncbi:MAG: BamA/TamA family outer membrane protein [Candidatus Latescibacterota bacterium]
MILRSLLLILLFFLSYNPEPAGSETPSEEGGEDSRRFFILPTLTYTTDTGWGGGFAVFKAYHPERARISTVQSSILYTEKKQLISAFNLDHRFRNDRDRLFLSVRYIKFPTSFYGMGNETSVMGQESYTPEYLRALALFERGFGGGLRIQTGFYLRNQALVKREPDGILERGMVRWSRGRLDMGPVLGFQAIFEDSGGDVPFYLLSRLGGEEILRGYQYERFRDKSMALFQHDLRFPILNTIGGALFVAAGKVAPNARDLFSGGYHVGYGAGLRYYFNPKDNLLLRLDYAKGEDADGWYICFGEAF